MSKTKEIEFYVSIDADGDWYVGEYEGDVTTNSEPSYIFKVKMTLPIPEIIEVDMRDNAPCVDPPNPSLVLYPPERKG